MSQLTIKLSDKADALIAQLQKEIFNRRRKKVSAEGVIETLLESGAKSQSDKRFAISWRNLVADVEKAAKVAEAHGAKPANLTDEEWALVLSHRTRVSGGAAGAAGAARRKPAARRRPASGKAAAAAGVSGEGKAKAEEPRVTTRSSRTAGSKGKGKAAAGMTALSRKASGKTAATGKTPPPSRSTRTGARSSAARRMAKAVSRLGSAAATDTTVGAGMPAGNGAVAPEPSAG